MYYLNQITIQLSTRALIMQWKHKLWLDCLSLQKAERTKMFQLFYCPVSVCSIRPITTQKHCFWTLFLNFVFKVQKTLLWRSGHHTQLLRTFNLGCMSAGKLTWKNCDLGMRLFRDRPQISLLILSEFKRINKLFLPWNHLKTNGFLMISRLWTRLWLHRGQ